MSSGMTETTRQRMRPWLEARINSGDIKGLEWVDKNSRTFKVPWKHVGNRDWCENDGEIFKEWAIHTGRYREGVDNPDWPTWKTRFRCALTKLPDIKELKELNHLDGQTEEPYRVYKFLPRSNTNSPEVCMIPETPPQDQDMDVDEGVDQIPTTVNSGNGVLGESRLDSDLNNIPSADLIKVNSGEIKHIQQNGDMGMDSVDGNTDDLLNATTENDIQNKSNKPYQHERQHIETPPVYMDNKDPNLYLTVRYRDEVVLEQMCVNPNGFRIYHDNHVRLPEMSDDVSMIQMFGPPGCDQIQLPDCNTENCQQQKFTLQLLSSTDRGLVIKMVDGNIIAFRKCRCVVFISSPTLNGGETTKLEREQETVIFDLKVFKEALDRYIHQLGPKPSASVIIGFGQKFDHSSESLSDILISARLDHVAASTTLAMIACTSPVSPKLEISRSDNCDRFLDLCRFSHQTNQVSQEPTEMQY